LQSPGEFQERQLAGAFALRWLHADPTPRLIVDPGLWLIWQNAAAEKLLVDCPDLDARDGQLSVEDRQSNVALSMLVANAAEDVSTCIVPCMDGEGHLLFLARRLSVDGVQRVALCIQRAGNSYQPVYAEFSRTFGLTPTETRIVRMLMSGQTAEVIAERGGGSIGTVRSHIRSIYNKLDVSSREMMFHRLQPFRIA